ncbi:hypothetical protein V6N13_016918 [Hibiscus sabdariffa]
MKPTTFVLDEAVANSDNLTANHNRPRIAAASLHGECFATEVVPVSATNVSRSNGSSEALGLRKAPQKLPAGEAAEKMDMTELYGLAVYRKTPLHALAIPNSSF